MRLVLRKVLVAVVTAPSAYTSARLALGSCACALAGHERLQRGQVAGPRVLAMYSAAICVTGYDSANSQRLTGLRECQPTFYSCGRCPCMSTRVCIAIVALACEHGESSSEKPTEWSVVELRRGAECVSSSCKLHGCTSASVERQYSLALCRCCAGARWRFLLGPREMLEPVGTC